MSRRAVFRLKRVYDPPGRLDGVRVLVDRLWPRGLSRQKAQITRWCRDLAPSHELRMWYGHDRQRWPEFRRRYAAELRDNQAGLRALAGLIRQETVTLVFAASDAGHSNAVVLKSVVERLVRRISSRDQRGRVRRRERKRV